MLRNTPTEAERFKMQNSGYSLNQVRDMQQRQNMNMRMGAGSPTAFRMDARRDANNAAFMMANTAGATGAAQRAAAPSLALMAGMEGTAGMDPTAASAMMMMPPAAADTGEGRMGPSNQQQDPFSGGYQTNDPKDPYYRPRRKPRGFAMGTTIEGPGGPTDDMIPAVVDGVEPVRLSNGEEVVDAKTRDFFGKKFFLDLKKKAMKGEMEGMQMQKPKKGNVPGFANGATMVSPSFAKFEALKNAQSQTPELIPLREQQARDIRMAPMGIEDVATRARLREQDAMLSPDPYGRTLNDSPAFQPDPEALLDMRANRFLARSNEAVAPSTAPAPAPMPMMNGQQPPMMLAAPMSEPTMRPAPLTMTEKDRLMMPTFDSRTRRADPAFESAMVGLTGMEKRKARAALTMEEASFARDQGRADAAAQVAETRAETERGRNFEEWKQKQVIGDQFQQAADARRMGGDAAMIGEQRRYQEGRQVAEREQQAQRAKNFTDIPDTEYKINDLGNLVSKKTGKTVGLSPEEASKYGLEIAGADSEGRVRYAPAKPKVEVRRFYDPANAKIVELDADEMPPEGAGWKPIQRQTQAAAPAASAPADSGPVAVTSSDQWAKLKPGTRYTTPDGRVGTKK